MEKSKFVVCGRGCGSGGVGVWVARSAGVWAWVWVCVRCGWAVWVCGCVGSSVCGGCGYGRGCGCACACVFFFFLKKERFLNFFFQQKFKKCKKYGSQTSSVAQFLDFCSLKTKKLIKTKSLKKI